ncbi:MAG: iron-sulfur cluster assembly scaffold protein [Chloroflexi bacterium]|nr:iron-sulfur cluster assembly scaffold protein [Chloroflexota bacterium]
MPYSNVVLDHFFNPRHVGVLPSPDGYGVVGAPGEGDFVQMSIRAEEGKIVEARFRCFACPVAVAACDMAAQLLHAMSIKEARRLSPEELARALGGVPGEKMSRCRLALSAVKAALDDYEMRTLAASRSIDNRF